MSCRYDAFLTKATVNAIESRRIDYEKRFRRPEKRESRPKPVESIALFAIDYNEVPAKFTSLTVDADIVK